MFLLNRVADFLRTLLEDKQIFKSMGKLDIVVYGVFGI